MNIVLATSIAILTIAAANSLVVLRRSRDPRVWLLTGLLVLLGGAQGTALWTASGAPLAADAATAGAFATLGASCLALWVVRSVGRTLRELDRAEALHWSSMEAVRALAELAEDRCTDLEARVAQMLEIGCRCFGLEIGILSRVSGARYEVAAIRAPRDFPIGPGAAFPVSETWCRTTLVDNRPVGVTRVDDSSGASPGRSAFPFAAYLGVAVRDGERALGTLAFASLEPRTTRFTASEKDVLLLMARWIEPELASARSDDAVKTAPQAALGKEPVRVSSGQETRSVPPAPTRLSSGWEAHSVAPDLTRVSNGREAHSVAPDPTRVSNGWEAHSVAPDPTRVSNGWEAHSVAPDPTRVSNGREAHSVAPDLTRVSPPERSLDLNALLRRFEGKLRRTAGPDVRLALELDPDLAPARDPRIPLDTIVASLVRHAVAAMHEGGEITVSTANLELAGGEPGVLPAVAPDRYVTLCVRDSAASVKGDELSCLFDEPGEERGDGPLSFSRVYRMLQGCGGDLSVEVEPGRGSAWTVFLPRADAVIPRARPRRQTARADEDGDGVEPPGFFEATA